MTASGLVTASMAFDDSERRLCQWNAHQHPPVAVMCVRGGERERKRKREREMREGGREGGREAERQRERERERSASSRHGQDCPAAAAATTNGSRPASLTGPGRHDCRSRTCPSRRSRCPPGPGRLGPALAEALRIHWMRNAIADAWTAHHTAFGPRTEPESLSLSLSLYLREVYLCNREKAAEEAGGGARTAKGGGGGGSE